MTHHHVNPPLNCMLCKRDTRDGVALLRCKSCKVILYCGTNCQKRDWKKHRPFCRSVSRLNCTMAPRVMDAEETDLFCGAVELGLDLVDDHCFCFIWSEADETTDCSCKNAMTHLFYTLSRQRTFTHPVSHKRAQLLSYEDSGLLRTLCHETHFLLGVNVALDVDRKCVLLKYSAGCLRLHLTLLPEKY